MRPRRDAPVLAQRARGRGVQALDDWDLSAEDRETVYADYEFDKHAASAQVSRESLVTTWERLLHKWHGEEVPAVPVEPADIGYVGALMKARGYRSFANYVSRMKELHVKAGFYWSPLHELEAKQGTRSVTRGQGPARQSAPLSVPGAAVLLEGLGVSPVVPGGPTHPRGVIVLGSAFLLRELELATARAAHASVDSKRRCFWLELPVSKTDPSAIGCSRCWGCICEAHDGHAEPSCPYCVGVTHLAHLRWLFGEGEENALPVELPLFPTADGDTVFKENVVRTIEAAAASLGEELTDGGGRRRFGGHSLRVSGAKWLASIGIEVAKIQVLARWSSDVVLRYIGESHIQSISQDVKKARATRRAVDAVDYTNEESKLANTDSLQKKNEIERLTSAFDAKISEHDAKLEHRLSALELENRAAPSLVTNEKNGVLHVVEGPLELASSLWRTRCGWSFGKSPHFRLLSRPSAPPSALWCRRCCEAEAGGGPTRPTLAE